jgi:hypothetical protein
MSTDAIPVRARADLPMTALQAYRDDGPLALGIGERAAARFPLGELSALALAALVALVVLGVSVRPLPAVAVAIAMVVVVGLAATGARRGAPGRLGWMVPPLLRILEYGCLIRLTSLADPDAMPWCYALLGVLAFHHYDTVYRLRHQRVAPPAGIRAIGLGWDGRLLVATAFAIADIMGPGLLVAAIVLAVIYVGESVTSWARFAKQERPARYDEDEDDDGMGDA